LRERKKTALPGEVIPSWLSDFRKSSGRRLAQGPRDFSGSLDDKKTSRGVFVTTARFTRGAEDYVRGIPKSIILIDGLRADAPDGRARRRRGARADDRRQDGR
jgi:hypothetical protein